MAYILIDPKILDEKKVKFYKTIPDGRAIIETNMLKVLGSVKSVEFVATTKELNDIVNYQTKHLQNKVDNSSAVQQEESYPQTEEPSTEEQEQIPSVEQTEENINESTKAE